MPGPIRPDDIAQAKTQFFPELVFDAFNELIVRDIENGHAMVKQEDVVALMVKKGLKRYNIFRYGWLNVEAVYRAIGWDVEYDKPGYNESYEPTFTFKRK